MTQTRPYYASGSLSAAYYDFVTGLDASLAGDIDLYASLPPADGSILELGAGSGRLTLELAARGFEVLGVDIAPAMLSQAQTRLAQAPALVRERVTLRLGDMTSLNLSRVFDAVICPFFTLAHTPAGAAWRNTFLTAARHLSVGGLAAFHLPVLEVMKSPGPANPDLPVMDEATPDGGRLQLFVRSKTFKAAIGRLDQVIEYRATDAAGVNPRRSSERLTFYMTDPDPLAAAAGLVRERDPVPLGGVGNVHIFRKI